jgi:hypothetical protein
MRRQHRMGEYMRAGRMVVAGVGALTAMTLTAGTATAASPSGSQFFLVVNTSTANGSATAPVSAIGPIHALGKDIPLSANKDRFAFPKGAIIVMHKPTKNTETFDRGSCTGHLTQQGTFKVISGTGAYAKAQGSGTYALNGYFLGCGKNATAASVIIKANGKLSY